MLQMNTIDIIDLLIGVVGLLPILIALNYWFFKHRPVKKFLSFEEQEPVDIIVTTSNFSASDTGASVMRPTTSIGQLEGVAFIARLLGRFYRKKELIVNMSKNVHRRLNRDLLLLGGPAKNEFTKRFLIKFSDSYPDFNFLFDEIDCNLNFKDIIIENAKLEQNGSNLENDYAIVIVWHNPFAIKSRRAILYAGFSSYGTSGAENWIFDDLLMNRQLFSKMKKIKIRKKSNFIALLKIHLIENQVIGIDEIKIENL